MKKITLVLALVLGVALGTPAFAHEGHSMGMDGMKGQSQQCPIATKAMKKAHFLLQHKDDIGLSADQVKQIQDMKLQIEKDSIHQTADMQAFMLDLDAALMNDTLDVNAGNALIDKGFAAASAAAKANLASYAKLKAILTPDQLTKMKALHEKEERMEEGGMMKKGGMGMMGKANMGSAENEQEEHAHEK